MILGGGAVAGAVALGATPLAPLMAFGVVWGWVEQKGLAVDLLKSAVDSVSGKVSGLQGLEKRELIAAAHSTIVVAAVFESFRKHTDKELYAKLKFTDHEKLSVIKQMARYVLDENVARLYALEIPAPSAACGFEENVFRVQQWQILFIRRLADFIHPLAVSRNARFDEDAVIGSAQERYRSRYLELAAKVPEFAIWAELGEHGATRTTVREVGTQVANSIAELATDVAELSSDTGDLGTAIRESNVEVAAALNANRDALNRVAALLAVSVPSETHSGAAALSGGTQPPVPLSGLRTAASWANARILGEPVIPADPERYPADLTIPRVSEIYVNPRYRVARIDLTDESWPADDRWWDTRVSRDDFDLLLTAHVVAPDATRLPLLLLGHPGAGKSLLTKVLAARLPNSEYTVVRVPLRRVNANARIHRQIEEALEISTDQRIAWSDLAQQSTDTVRVVLLDGLDELLQASEHDRSSYLEDVVDFQEREANQRRPVVAIVTSRTVVADRVRIPDGTTIVKLDSFTDDDVADWVARWKRVNADAIVAGSIGELTLHAAQRQPELAEQPLLLLMLALYAADKRLPPLDEDMATAELYRRLLEGFARREAAKDLGLGRDPSPDELDQRVQDHLERLAVAALGMFNRGRQDISEEELGKDLEVMEPRLLERSRPVEAGQRIIGEFFFVYAPEARTLTSHQARGGQPQRAYEFLHATFGEYLVARRIVDELVDVAAKAFASRRGPADLDDQALFALLSHQALAGRWSMLDFAKEIFGAIGQDDVRTHVLETLELLVSGYRNRPGADRYTAYRPGPADQVRQLAHYSANLVALRVVLEPSEAGVSLAKLLRVPEPSLALDEWRITPSLWKAGLDSDGLKAIVSAIVLADAPPRLKIYAMRGTSLAPVELSLARLVDDQSLVRRMRYGSAITDDYTASYVGNDSWVDMMASWLIPLIAGVDPVQGYEPPPAGTSDKDIATIANLIFDYLRSPHTDDATDVALLDMLLRFPPVFTFNRQAIAVAVLRTPGLLTAFPDLKEITKSSEYATIIQKAESPRAVVDVDLRSISDETVAAIRQFISDGTM